MATFDDFGTAQKTREAIARVAREEINRQRPAPRYAVVQSIDLEDRSIMGVFVGESEAVRIPFLDVIPATVGQEVRVTGVGSDRVVDGVRGSSDAEARVAQLEEQLAHWSKRAYAHAQLTADFSTSTTAGKIPFNSPLGVDPYYIDVEADGSFLVSIAGDYKYGVTIQTESFRNSTVQIWVACLPNGGVQFDLQNLQNQLLSGSTEYFDSTPFTAQGYIHLGEGDRVYTNVHSAVSGIMLRKYGSRMSLELKNPDPITLP